MFQNLQGPLIFPSPRRDCCSSSSDRGSSHAEMGWAIFFCVFEWFCLVLFSLWMFRSFFGRFSIPPFIFRSPLFIAKSRKFDGKSWCHQANTSEYRLAEIWSHFCTLPLCLVSWVTNSRQPLDSCWQVFTCFDGYILIISAISSSYLRHQCFGVLMPPCHQAFLPFFSHFTWHVFGETSRFSSRKPGPLWRLGWHSSASHGVSGLHGSGHKNGSFSTIDGLVTHKIYV